MKQWLKSARHWVGQHKQSLLRVGGGVVVVLVVVQIFYPGDRLLPFASVDGIGLGGSDKKTAVNKLDQTIAKQRIAVALGSVREDYDEPLPKDFGLTIRNQERIDQLSYPWFVRIVPTSLFWYGLVQNDAAPRYDFDKAKTVQYVTAKFGPDCLVPAKDATLELKDETLRVVPSAAGGDCDEPSAVKEILATKPRANQSTKVTIPATIIAPVGGDDAAKKLATTLNETTKGGVQLKVADKTQTIAQKDILSWLTFTPSVDALSYDINADPAGAYLAKTATPLIAKPAGVTKVTTADFTETSRFDGPAGQTLNLGGTLEQLRRVLDNQAEAAQAQVAALPPKVEYTRTYSKTSTGIAAQLKFYDDDTAGDFGVTFSELDGRGLQASHNGDRQFVTASTYKLFVAFSTIKRVESDQMKWTDGDIAGGRNLSTCFDDMIVKSDNACAEALIKKIGAKSLNEDIKSLGLINTAFRADNNVTTANDLAKYLTQLEKGTMPIKSENRDRLLGAMKRNVYRQGVPAGASGQVADKVGFLWGLLHDAAIVYSPKGTYVLVVLSDGASWGNIADITRKIEALR